MFCPRRRSNSSSYSNYPWNMTLYDFCAVRKRQDCEWHPMHKAATIAANTFVTVGCPWASWRGNMVEEIQTLHQDRNHCTELFGAA